MTFVKHKQREASWGKTVTGKWWSTTILSYSPQILTTKTMKFAT